MLLLLKTDRQGLRTFGWQMAIAWPLLFSLLLGIPLRSFLINGSRIKNDVLKPIL